LSIAAEEPRKNGLLHILGTGFGIAVGIGMMIGSGILRSPSSIAAGIPSAEWIIALWVMGAVHAALGANIYAELATAIPKAGGGYVYVHRALGDIGGLIVGWSNWLSDLAGIAAASASFASFLAQLWPQLADYDIALAVGMQLVLYGANVLGLREGRMLQQSTSLVKALLLLVFIIAAAAIAGEMPAAHVASATAPAIGWLALIGAYQLIRGAYAGWEAPVYFAEENAQPGKAIPRALGIGLLLTAVLYVGVNLALVAALGVAGTARSVLPFTTVLMHFGGSVPSVLFAFGAMITVASCANANMMSAPRILFALSRDGLLPRALTRVNAGGSPTIAFAMTAVGSIVLAATGSFETVFGLIGVLNSLAGILIGITIFVLRAREPDLARPFRAMGYPVFPALVLLADAALLVLFLWHQISAGDLNGAIAAVALSLACIPFAVIARHTKGATP
jgi:APA family basic amino acid/polyamine antiporter